MDIKSSVTEISSKGVSKLINIYAKILGKKGFKKEKFQQNDDQIISVVQEVYLAPELRQKQVGEWILDEQFNFLVHAAYKHSLENRVLICYRGTDFKNIQDIISDAQIILGVNSIDSRVQDSWNFYDKVLVKYPNCKIRISGHSLGGTISYIVAKHREPERCIVFNPGAAPTRSLLSMLQDTLLKKEWTKGITTYKIRGDIISTLSFVGNVKSFIVKSANPLKLHTIDSFPELFQKDKNNSD